VISHFLLAILPTLFASTNADAEGGKINLSYQTVTGRIPIMTWIEFAFGKGYNSDKLVDINILSNEEMMDIKGEFWRSIVRSVLDIIRTIDNLSRYVDLEYEHGGNTISAKMINIDIGKGVESARVTVAVKRNEDQFISGFLTGEAVKQGKNKVKIARHRVARITETLGQTGPGSPGRGSKRSLRRIRDRIALKEKWLSIQTARMEAVRNEIIRREESSVGNGELIVDMGWRERFNVVVLNQSASLHKLSTFSRGILALK